MEKVRFAIAGLGRLGKIHADQLQNQIPGAEITAACSIDDRELDYARNVLGVKKTFLDYDEMIDDGNFDAVAIVTSSAAHCGQLTRALEAGKHVFCEKPLGVTIEECLAAEKVVNAHPELIFQLGFMRRFDPSYRYAMEKIRAGMIGEPYFVKAVGLDPLKLLPGAMNFLATSGGIFVDMAIHDIDLMRWFLGAEPETVFAVGTTFGFPEIAKIGDVEAGCALYRFENGAMATIHTSRTAPHGYHIETEIVGTKGVIRIGQVPAKNGAVLYTENGVGVDCVEAFPERFETAFLEEKKAFVESVRSGVAPEIKVADGVRSAQIAIATTRALQSGELVNIKFA